MRNKLKGLFSSFYLFSHSFQPTTTTKNKKQKSEFNDFNYSCQGISNKKRKYYFKIKGSTKTNRFVLFDTN